MVNSYLYPLRKILKMRRNIFVLSFFKNKISSIVSKPGKPKIFFETSSMNEWSWNKRKNRFSLLLGLPWSFCISWSYHTVMIESEAFSCWHKKSECNITLDNTLLNTKEESSNQLINHAVKSFESWCENRLVSNHHDGDHVDDNHGDSQCQRQDRIKQKVSEPPHSRIWSTRNQNHEPAHHDHIQQILLLLLLLVIFFNNIKSQTSSSAEWHDSGHWQMVFYQ